MGILTPATAADIQKREVRLIKIAQRELGSDDETYRDMLWNLAKVRSASDLDWQGRKKVLDHMKKSGFKVKSSAANRNAAAPTYRKIRALWTEMHVAGVIQHDTDAAVQAYVKRLTAVDDYQFLNQHQIVTVIESLKRWQRRTAHANPAGMVKLVHKKMKEGKDV